MALADLPDVSVVIVNWNAKTYLRRCLDSLASSSQRHSLQVIVVDNASTDGSADLVQDHYPQVDLIRNPANVGFARGNNIGVSKAQAKYLCFINSDVEVDHDCISLLVDFCEADARVGIVGPKVIGSDGKLQRSCRGFPTPWNMFCRALALDHALPSLRLFSGYGLLHWPQDTTRPVDILTGCFWLVRREAMQQVGLLDESFFIYGEDMDWCKRFNAAGWDVVFCPRAEAMHYGGASSANSPIRFYIERQKADLQYWRKHHSRVSVALYYAISSLHLTLRALGYAVAVALKRGGDVERAKVRRSLACLKWLVAGRV